MADIRIKDLATLESASLTGDVFVIDGTTGTRKLSAFSPTFGGNATVTGTLTVNGTGTSEFGGLVRITAGGFRSYGSMTLGATYAGMGGGFQTSYDTPTTRIFYGDGTGFDLRFATRASSTTTDRFTFSDTGKLTISGTDASTTTSSGALVVGNGTSGGLGVGGAASIGGPILVGTSSDVYVSRVATGILDIRSASSPGTTARLDVTGTTSAGVGFRQSGTRDWFISAESAELRVTCGTSGSIFAVTNGNPVALRDTTASSAYNVGALVVSGGVGVGNEVSVYGRVRAQLGLHADGNVPNGLAAAYQVDVQALTARDILSFGDGARAGLIRGYHDGSGVVQFRFGRYTASSFEEQMRLSGTSATSSSLTIYGTTASTSTSSGALVVSGGVGVAGAIWAGDNITVPNSKNFVVRNAAASSTAMRMYADSSDFGYIDCTANTELRLQVGSGTKLSITNTGNVTTTGNITTAAPSGGTAAAWKLGTVATVSPTSPNRTIEVDIGGTIYYIHAKTTNN